MKFKRPKSGNRTYAFDDGHLKISAKFAWLDDDVIPWRIYAWYPSSTKPATYVEYEREDGEVRKAIVHNFYAYKALMDFWKVDITEAIILNELHELTHEAMTEEERERWESVGKLRHVLLWNPFLIKLIRAGRQL